MLSTACIGRSAVNGSKVKGNNIAWFDRPSTNIELVPVGSNAWYRRHLITFIERLAVEKLWLIQVTVQMRTGNELKRSVTLDVIERYPKADGLRSFDAIIRLVLVPWRCNIGLHFFDQDVLVEQANGLTLHQFGCNLPNGGVKNEILVFGYPLPIAVITV